MPLWEGNCRASPNLETPVEDPLSEQRRLALLKSTLLILSLKPPPRSDLVIAHPLPQLLTSHPLKLTIVSKIANSIAAYPNGSQLSVFEDKCDTFGSRKRISSRSLISRKSGTPVCYLVFRHPLCPSLRINLQAEAEEATSGFRPLAVSHSRYVVVVVVA